MAEAVTKPVGPLAKPPVEEICGNCAYYQPLSASDLSRGHCLRYPPMVVNDSHEADTEAERFATVLPTVDEIDWCGEYRYLAPTDMKARDLAIENDDKLMAEKANNRE
jgi:hypothetical protein